MNFSNKDILTAETKMSNQLQSIQESKRKK